MSGGEHDRPQGNLALRRIAMSRNVAFAAIYVAEGTINEVTYWWPRPGSDKPLEKTSFFTKVGDQICGVGYYK
jgi:hypothetical protein